MATIKDDLLDGEITQSEQNMNECFTSDDMLFNYWHGYASALKMIKTIQNNQP
ncbi:hypothetical protein [uncultured Winogradskyella sp.]|uniref:hypothetical protein n=1 Tax=uncultured Winogradskyella sp. TaxID=395353 RepID=UPI002611068A|nr:hypothetical protein [uncultured Winogradskyella sp.]